MKLTHTKLASLAKPGKYFDGGGLYLELTAAGGRYWRLKYRHGGKENRLALGVFPTVPLKVAREKASAARAQLAAGLDPSAERKVARAQAEIAAENTLQAVADDWMAHQQARWGDDTREAIRSSLARYILPQLGARLMTEIRPTDVMNAVKAIERRGAGDQAGRVLQRVKSIYRWALVHERIQSNPMVDLVPAEILRPRQVTHRPALAARDLPGFLAKLDAYVGDPHTIGGLRLLMLTATRPGETRGAVWSEFDLAGATWTIPAARMKMGREHRVPLSRQALQLLEQMRPLSGDNPLGLVFPSPVYPSKPLSENTFNSAMARMGYKGSATAHGFRALFSTVANEAGWSPDAIERQLAHVEGDRVRAAYHRSQYLEERAKLMQWWADHLDAQRKPAPARRRSRS